MATSQKQFTIGQRVRTIISAYVHHARTVQIERIEQRGAHTLYVMTDGSRFSGHELEEPYKARTNAADMACFE